MSKTLGLGILAVAASATAFAVYQGGGATLLATFGKALNDAKAVRTTYTIRTVGGSSSDQVSEEYSVALKKPNLARIETPGELIVMDGKQVTTYTKGDNTFFRRPETEGDLKSLLSDGDLSILLGFADPNAYQAPVARALGQQQMNGVSVNKVEAKFGHATTTYYLDAADNVARTCTTDYKTAGGSSASVIIHATALELNPNLPDATFMFNPPDGAHELSLDEINAGKWFTNLADACKVAQASNRRAFIDFMATWCGPCKMLDEQCFHTDTFKSLAKKFVLCRIDVDQQPDLGAQYGASAIPLQVIADSSGGVIDKKVGYGGPEDFFAFLRKNAG